MNDRLSRFAPVKNVNTGETGVVLADREDRIGGRVQVEVVVEGHNGPYRLTQWWKREWIREL